MPTEKLMPQLTTDETVAADRLFEELLAEFGGATVRGLDTARRPVSAAETATARTEVA
ncbi:hypothetical protein NBH00_10620 [Paraconexibacter antarcticus]|uniref:Uncharacterized protein n=1 Tax=Paraconexibacter antarcticus TaxID=2949664 RepID=A0ABY5E0C0_9ACTN|nr:hypothetical protein [Paraconexibacter antarcticus]UTI66644.1 hypothetical protein NBH00_10620 [Paraconexibacter antarcticus]